MKIRWAGFIVTGLIFLVTTISLATQGLNLGLDFTGGVQIEATREEAFDVGMVREEIQKAGFEDSVITTSASSVSQRLWWCAICARA